MLSAVLFAVSLPAAAAPVPSPPEPPATVAGVTLVYAFHSQAVRGGGSDKAYGLDKMDPGGGGTFLFHNVNQHYIAASPDESAQRAGTIAVTIERRQDDGALVVRVVQAPSPDGKSQPFECAVFADTSLICDPQRTLAPEAETLLRLLSPDFAAPAADADKWNVTRGDGSGTLQFTAKRERESLTVGESGVLNGPLAWKTNVAATIDYDTARALPTTVRQLTVAERHRGVVEETVSTDTTISLIGSATATRSTIP